MPDPTSPPAEIFAYWKQLAGDTSPTPWKEENLGMFFQEFRPYGRGVEAAFQGVVGADEILPRLREVYEATAPGWDGNAVFDYFVVRKPKPLTASQAAELAAEYLGKVLNIAREFGADADDDDPVVELQALLDPLPTLEVVLGEPPHPPDVDSPEGLIYELTTDFMSYLELDLEPVQSHAHLMGEAFYTLACDHNLAYYLLWPLFRHLTPITEPFAAYFELWKHGASCRFHERTLVRVYVPNLAQ